MEREALKLALEALERTNPRFSEDVMRQHEAITAIKEALAQPAQEPTGMLHIERLDKWLDASLKEHKQRPWVGLTDEEIETYLDWDDWQVGTDRSIILGMVRDIEAKLRSKNT